MLQIVNYEEALPGTYLLATFDVYLGPKWGLSYRRWKLLKGKKGIYVTSPVFLERSDDDGTKHWGKYIDFSSSEKRVDFQQKVMDALKEFVRPEWLENPNE